MGIRPINATLRIWLRCSEARFNNVAKNGQKRGFVKFFFSFKNKKIHFKKGDLNSQGWTWREILLANMNLFLFLLNEFIEYEDMYKWFSSCCVLHQLSFNFVLFACCLFCLIDFCWLTESWIRWPHYCLLWGDTLEISYENLNTGNGLLPLDRIFLNGFQMILFLSLFIF